MLARSRTCISMPSTNNSFENHHNYIDYGTLHVDRKKDRHTDEKDRKSMDSISRRPSFSHRKMLGKPRSLSTCPVYPAINLGPCDGLACHNPEASTTPTFAPYLYSQDRKFSLNLDSNGLTPDELAYFQDTSWTYSGENGDNYGTRRARSTNSVRKSLFSGRDKINGMLDKIFSQIVANRANDLSFLDLEDHWASLVKTHKQLNKKSCEQQEAIWEIITTEKRYLMLLQHMEDLTLCFVELQKQGVLRDISCRRVFLNYGELLRCNLMFWKRAILPLLLKSRESGTPLNPKLLLPGFQGIIEWSRCYIDFNVGHAESHAYVQKKQKESEMFNEFVRWAESLNAMNRQKLLDTLTTPMQRLTRYTLLLKAVLKTTTDSDEKVTIQSMIDRTEAATLRLNYEMSNNELRIQLSEIMKSIESYDVIDNEEFDKLFQSRSACHLNLTNPMPFMTGAPKYRRLYTRGDLKIREGKQGPKIDAHCLLFTDMFLICKATSKRNDRFRIIKAPMHVSNIIVHPFNDGTGFYFIFMNEFDSASILLMVSTTGIEESRRWLEMIAMAQDEFKRLRTHDFEALLLEKEKQLNQRKEVMKSDLPATAPANVYPTNPLFNMDIHAPVVHKKSHSMDSQVVAASRPNSTVLRKSDTISSAEQLDRRFNDSLTNATSRSSINSNTSDKLLLSPRNESPSTTIIHMNGHHEPKENFAQNGHVNGGDHLDEVYPGCSAPENTPHTESMFSFEQTPTIEEDPPEDGSENSTPRFTQSANNGRRFEKRYHTVGEIESNRPHLPNGAPSGILKRFSWNVSSAMSGSSRKISSKLNELNGRRLSQSTACSSDSFSSSTSGISSASASSYDTSTIASSITTDTLLADQHDSSKKRQYFAEKNSPHVSTVHIGESIEIIDKMQNGNESNEARATPPPPLPEVPPPDVTVISAKQKKPPTELLRFILDDQLETSEI